MTKYKDRLTIEQAEAVVVVHSDQQKGISNAQYSETVRTLYNEAWKKWFEQSRKAGVKLDIVAFAILRLAQNTDHLGVSSQDERTHGSFISRVTKFLVKERTI